MKYETLDEFAKDELRAKFKKAHKATKVFVGPSIPGKSFWCSIDELAKRTKEPSDAPPEPRQQT